MIIIHNDENHSGAKDGKTKETCKDVSHQLHPGRRVGVSCEAREQWQDSQHASLALKL